MTTTIQIVQKVVFVSHNYLVKLSRNKTKKEDNTTRD